MAERRAEAALTGGVAWIALHVADGRVARVAITPPPVPDLTAIMRGREAAAVPPLVRLMFPICGAAHEAACAGAIAAAQGRVAEGAAQHRDAVLIAEIALAHAMRATLYWPPALGYAADPSAMAGVVRAGADYRDGPAPETARSLVEALRFAVFADAAFDVTGMAALAAWAHEADAVSAQAVRAAASLPLRDPETAKLAAASPEWFAARLAADHAFAARPEVEGLPAEAGPFAALDAQDAKVAAQHGPAAARLLAMLQAAAKLSRALDAEARPAAQIGSRATAPDTGCAVVQTARGPLAYRVRLDAGGCVAEIRSLAPTAFALHPAGPLAQMLTGAPVAAAESAARLAAAAVDPCADVQIDITEAAHA